MEKTMTLKPRISEKAYGQSQAANVYVFVVPQDANKLTVAQAVEAQFEVTVLSVNITNVKGKVKTSYRKRGARNSGSRNDIKKAYVTVRQGDTIPVFASEEDEKPAAEKKGKK
jgi:large subunit ribosomal protein L23